MTQFNEQSLPESIGNLSNTLEMLDLENNNISTLPDSLALLKKIVTIDLSGNK